jgi:predicted nucleic acid-binding protein
LNRVFADTSYFLALLAPNDAYRDLAIEWTRTATSRVVTTEYVLLEVGNHLSSVGLRGVCADFLASIREESEVTVVPASTLLLDRAVELF